MTETTEEQQKKNALIEEKWFKNKVEWCWCWHDSVDHKWYVDQVGHEMLEKFHPDPAELAEIDKRDEWKKLPCIRYFDSAVVNEEPSFCPDYCNDHNAVAELRDEIAKQGYLERFLDEIYNNVKGILAETDDDYCVIVNYPVLFSIVNASPETQVDAALRTLGIL